MAISTEREDGESRASDGPRVWRWRRLVQFRLRTLLVFTALFAGLLSAWKVYVAPYQQQDAAMKRIMAVCQCEPAAHNNAPPVRWVARLLGDRIYWNVAEVRIEGIDDRTLERIVPDLARLPWLEQLKIGDSPITDEGLRHLAGLTHLREIFLYSTSVRGHGLTYLNTLWRLVSLQIHACPVADDAVPLISQFKGLQSLSLCGTQITDAALAKLGFFPDLKSFALDDTRVTGSGFEHLSHKAPNLLNLSVRNCPVTDDALVHLHRLEQLWYLGLDGTNVTNAGLENVKLIPKLENVSLISTRVSREAILQIGEILRLRRPDNGLSYNSKTPQSVR